MIDQIKNMALMLLTALSLLLGAWGLIVSHQFTKYKESVNDQVQLAKDEKNRIESEQNKRYETAQIGYSGALDELNKRLRNAQTVSRAGCVQVADQGGAGRTVPGGTRDTTGVEARLITYQGTCSIDFYADAMKDNLQCQKLLEYLK